LRFAYLVYLLGESAALTEATGEVSRYATREFFSFDGRGESTSLVRSGKQKREEKRSMFISQDRKKKKKR
jgi:hypothetical protein